jgi:hypothetical protein
MQYVDFGNKNVTSIEIYDQKLNKKPSDRDQLIEPDISGFREVKHDTSK